MSPGTLWCMYIEHISLLILCPYVFSCFLKTSMINCKENKSVDKNIIILFGYARSFTLGLPLGNPKPLNYGIWCSAIRLLVNTSVIKINKVGDSGSPCFTPWRLEETLRMAIYKYKILVLLIILNTISISLSEYSTFLSTLVKSNQDTLSYVLAISSFSTKLDIFVLNLMFEMLLWVGRIFSTILLPFTKLAWFRDIILPNSLTSLSWISLEKSYSKNCLN